MKTKLQIIEEVLRPYIAEPSKRALTDNGTCSYLLPDGRMCALGQCLEPTHNEYRNLISENTAACGITGLNDRLKPGFRGHENDFWDNLQDFHDGNKNWDEQGLSPVGTKNLEELKKKWSE